MEENRMIEYKEYGYLLERKKKVLELILRGIAISFPKCGFFYDRNKIRLIDSFNNPKKINKDILNEENKREIFSDNLKDKWINHYKSVSEKYDISDPILSKINGSMYKDEILTRYNLYFCTNFTDSYVKYNIIENETDSYYPSSKKPRLKEENLILRDVFDEDITIRFNKSILEVIIENLKKIIFKMDIMDEEYEEQIVFLMFKLDVLNKNNFNRIPKLELENMYREKMKEIENVSCDDIFSEYNLEMENVIEDEYDDESDYFDENNDLKIKKAEEKAEEKEVYRETLLNEKNFISKLLKMFKKDRIVMDNFFKQIIDLFRQMKHVEIVDLNNVKKPDNVKPFKFVFSEKYDLEKNKELLSLIKSNRFFGLKNRIIEINTHPIKETANYNKYIFFEDYLENKLYIMCEDDFIEKDRDCSLFGILDNYFTNSLKIFKLVSDIYCIDFLNNIILKKDYANQCFISNSIELKIRGGYYNTALDRDSFEVWFSADRGKAMRFSYEDNVLESINKLIGYYSDKKDDNKEQTSFDWN